MIRPIGKNTKLACFEKEATEGVFVNPTREIPFKSCDLKKVMKVEEDTSNIGEVFTSDLVTMGYDLTGNIEMNVYPETIGDILYFTLGKDVLGNPIKGVLTLKYVGDEKGARYKIYDNAGDISLLFETYDEASWNTLVDIEVESKTLAQIKTAIEEATSDLLVNVIGVGTGADFKIMADPLIIKNEGENVLGLIFARKSTSSYKSHNIYASNSALDSIPSFSLLLDKNYGEGKCFGYSGAKINTLSLSYAVKTFVTASLSVRAKEEYSNITDTSADFETTTPYLTNQVEMYLDGVRISDIKDFKLDVNNNMYIDEAVGLNTYNTQDRQGGIINVSGTANLTVDDTDRTATQRINDKYISNEAVDLIIVMNTNNLIEADVYSKTIIYIPKIKLSDGTVSIGGGERLSLSFAGQAVKSNLYDRHIDVFVNNKKITDY